MEQPLYFTRTGRQVEPAKVHIDGASVFTFEPRACSRCGGEGRSDRWIRTGRTCFDCGGSGQSIKGPRKVKLYTAEKLEKLVAAAKKRDTKKAAAAEEKRIKAAAEADARRADFLAEFGDLLRKADAYAERSGFIADVIAKGLEKAHLSEKQVETLTKAIEKMAAEDARKASAGWVGEVGKRVRKVKVKVVRRKVFGSGTLYEPFYYITTMHTEEGNTLVYKGGAFGPEPGAERVIDFTVKAHNEYNGEKQTIVARIVKHQQEENSNV